MNNINNTFITKSQEVINLIKELGEPSKIEETFKEESLEESFKVEEEAGEKSNSSQETSLNSSSETKGYEFNMAKIERTYGELTHQELQTIAYELGIVGIHSKPDTKLRKDIMEAHMVQKLYADREDFGTSDNTMFEQLGHWMFAYDLRMLGVSNESIKLLVENHIVTKEALQRMSKEELKEIQIFGFK